MFLLLGLTSGKGKGCHGQNGPYVCPEHVYVILPLAASAWLRQMDLKLRCSELGRSASEIFHHVVLIEFDDQGNHA